MHGDRVPIINGLRGAAILAVIYHHVFAPLTPPGTGAISVGGFELYPLALLTNGWLGVGLFFVLSGFVLALPYERGTRQLASWADVRSFCVRRAARLLPLYYLVSLLGFAFGPPAARTLEVFLHLVFVTFPFTAETFLPLYNWVLWSLGVEIAFSVVFPGLLWVRQRVGVAGVLVPSLLLSGAMRAYGSQARFWEAAPGLNHLKDGMVGRLDDFVLGMALAAVFVHAGDRRPNAWQRAVLVLVAGVALLVTCQSWDAVKLRQLDLAVIPYLYNLFQLSCAAGILALLFSSRGWLHWLWTRRSLQLLGMMCYSLYVWHGVLIGQLAYSAPRQYTFGSLLAYFGFLLALSALTYRYVEFGRVRDGRALFVPPAR